MLKSDLEGVVGYLFHLDDVRRVEDDRGTLKAALGGWKLDLDCETEQVAVEEVGHSHFKTAVEHPVREGITVLIGNCFRTSAVLKAGYWIITNEVVLGHCALGTYRLHSFIYAHRRTEKVTLLLT